MLRIRFTNSAEADLLPLWLTIAEENLIAADESLDSIQSTISLLATQPEMDRERSELADGLRSRLDPRKDSFDARQPYRARL